MKNPIIMHINYCEQGQTLPKVFEVASRIGYDGIEFRRSGDNYHLPLESYLGTIAALPSCARFTTQSAGVGS